MALTMAVAAMSGGDRMSYLLIALIGTRIRIAKQHFARIAARIAAGTYVPRRSPTPRTPSEADLPKERRPRPPSQLPRKFGWLLPMVPEAVQYRAQLVCLLRNPEMAALIAAAPAAFARPLRSLCWMLRIDPPEILPRRPAKPRKPRQPQPKREKLPPYWPPTPPNAPSWWGSDQPVRTRLSHGRPRSRGSPKTT
jgi:hypothetical protein